MSNNKLQERKTKVDTENSQSELKDKIRHKYLDRPWFTYEETRGWTSLVNDSLLSQGRWKDVVYSHPSGWQIYFGNLHKVLLKMPEMAKDKKEHITIVYMGRKFRIDLKDLWKTLYDDFIDVVPSVLSEATHMSAESPKKTKRSSYTWKAEGT